MAALTCPIRTCRAWTVVSATTAQSTAAVGDTNTEAALAPSYIALGFAAGAGVVAVGLATGLAPGGLGGLLVVFALASGVAWWGLRRVFGTPGSAQRFEDDIND